MHNQKKKMFHNLYVEFVGQNISAIVAKEYYFHETCSYILLKSFQREALVQNQQHS